MVEKTVKVQRVGRFAEKPMFRSAFKRICCIGKLGAGSSETLKKPAG